MSNNEFEQDISFLQDDDFELSSLSNSKKKEHTFKANDFEYIAGVKLKKSGQIFFFPTSIKLEPDNKVIVELEIGLVFGSVVSVCESKDFPSYETYLFEGVVKSLATAKDIAAHAENSILSAEANAFCKTCIRQRDLEMKLIDVEVLHDRSKIIFFFTAPSRIDFRELVKDLVRMYKTRIELRQIGIRHEAQMAGGLGNCGSVCCCNSYLRKFAPVTIKMAKEQNLFLNPAKLSGLCGRLLCCLSFEQENYEKFNMKCPKTWKKYSTSQGIIKITRTNMFKDTVHGIDKDNNEVVFTIDEWEALDPKRLEQNDECNNQNCGNKNTNTN